ncbi:putative Predicted protein [Carnobacterium maltaromaticum]|uniref:hypothetical protein n=1 Tax=Carnobacterium maltaromaticum TaxID=2751 RepID=UPI000704FFC2|nr:hypothetical protein [Carnobacterium maltaromaticum]KRN72383.1 hypothetical protein IV76_GL002609 [Carnobacterium maltaromaticum]CRH18078.1 putative Predicted protein [Carnobacterium maltaromaticum]
MQREININLDLGNLWEMLGAIGTIGAVIVSLYFSLKSNKKTFDVIFDETQYHGNGNILILSKNHYDSFRINELWCIVNFKKIKLDTSVINVLSNKEYPLKRGFPYTFYDNDIIKLELTGIEKFKGKKVKFVVVDINMNKFYSSKIII